MREAKKIRLRHAYLGPLTADQIARSAAISTSVLRRFWAEEKAAGNLPNVRPHYVEKTTLAAPVVEPQAARELAVAIGETPAAEADDETDDEPPLAGRQPSYVAQCDRLLESMRKHHPELDHAGVQDVSANLLRFDLRGMPMPTHGMLMAMCRAADHGALVKLYTTAPGQ